MKTLIPVLYVASGLSSGPMDIRIPLTVNRRSDLVASIIFPLAETRVVDMTLTSHDESIVTAVSTSREVPYMLFSDSRDVSQVYHRVEDGHLVIWPPRTTRTGSSFLGIGVGSAVTQSSGSAAVLKYGDNRAQLLLGSSLAIFNESCLPNSLMTLNKTELEMGHSLIGFSGITVGGFSIRIRSGFPFRAVVPESQFERLIESISDAGAVLVPRRLFERVQFSNCTIDLFHSLPDLEIRFDEGNRIVIFPEDYLATNESSGTCEMRIDSGAPGSSEIWLNPLMLVDTNVRFNNNSLIHLCDSNGNF